MTNVIELANQAGIPFNKYGLIGCYSCERDIDDELELFATLVRNATLDEALNSYSPDDTAADYLEKIEDLKEPTP